jgi:hypothetical protein
LEAFGEQMDIQGNNVITDTDTCLRGKFELYPGPRSKDEPLGDTLEMITNLIENNTEMVRVV